MTVKHFYAFRFFFSSNSGVFQARKKEKRKRRKETGKEGGKKEGNKRKRKKCLGEAANKAPVSKQVLLGSSLALKERER